MQPEKINVKKRNTFKKIGVGIIGTGLLSMVPSVIAKPFVFKDTNIESFQISKDGNDSFKDLNLNDNNIINLKNSDYTVGLPNPSHKEGRVFYDDTNKSLAYYNDESNVTMQVGQELWMRVYNNSGSDIGDGKAVTVVGVDANGVPEIDLSIASEEIKALNTIGATTHTIEDGTFGYVTTQGFIHGLNTTLLQAGSLMYLSDTELGGFTTVKPESPSYEVKMGGVAKSDAIDGLLYIEMLVLNNTQSAFKFYNGTILENHTVDVVSDCTDVTLTLDDSNDYLSMFFDGEQQVFQLMNKLLELQM